MLMNARFYLTFIATKSVKSMQMYEGISKSSWNESVTKDMLTFVIVCAVGPVFLPLLEAPGCSASVPELLRHPENNALLTVISFLDTRRNHNGPN
jgi:hypothetical protein